MNWIIQHSEKLRCHTDLKEILFSILTNIDSYNWLLTDLNFIADRELPINNDDDYFVLSNVEFQKIINSETQFIWGVIIGFDPDTEIIIDKDDLPFADGNSLIWTSENFQIKNASIEITAFDSSYTLVKFKDKNLSDKFKDYFDEAILLSEFNS